MDLSFFRRAEQRFASREAVRPDFGMLVAMLQAQQGESAAARWGAVPRVQDPLAEILLAGPGWRVAVAAQRGCFSPAVARQGSVN